MFNTHYTSIYSCFRLLICAIGYFMTPFIEQGHRTFSRELRRIEIRSSHSSSCIAHTDDDAEIQSTRTRRYKSSKKQTRPTGSAPSLTPSAHRHIIKPKPLKQAGTAIRIPNAISCRVLGERSLPVCRIRNICRLCTDCIRLTGKSSLSFVRWIG